ncbi:MAG: penicillin acylase family protein [Planctomycetota bacterium]
MTTSDRVARFPTGAFPLTAPATIHWDARQTPLIVAGADDDVPYLLGLTHAHQRLALMEILRHLAWGRASEMSGPLLNGIDHSIRALGLTTAVPEMEQILPPDTRRWIERYVQAINDHRERVSETPADYRTLGFDPDDPWTIADVLAIGRLLCADINWGRWLSLIPRASDPGYNAYVGRLRRTAAEGVPSFGPGEPTPLDLLLNVSKSGSNAFAITGDKTESGAALLGSDPHLGLPMPGLWSVVAYRSPESSAAGLTIAGLPFVLVGRNDHIAWGGTNMQALSSILYDATDLETTDRLEKLRTRWWLDNTVTVRETEHGPILTDAMLFKGLKRATGKDLAMRWTGHDATDEFTAFYKLSRATNFGEFVEAFDTFAAGGQNFVYADAEGHIGQVLATRYVPAAGRAAWVLPVDPADPRFAWDAGPTAAELPTAFDPESGVLVSGNNTPVSLDPPVVGQGNSNDRVVRMQSVLGGLEAATLDDFAALQRDVFSQQSLDATTAMLELAGFAIEQQAVAPNVLAALRQWDGRYTADSPGPVAYNLVLDALIDAVYPERYGGLTGTLRQASYVHAWVAQDIENTSIRADDVLEAFRAAERRFKPGTLWGDWHRLQLNHPIGNIPLLGRSYSFGDRPSGGTLSTVYKAASGIVSGKHSVTFGADARFLADMSSLDSNRVVLLGGQDGWMGSANFLDQVDPFLAGESFPLPLSAEGLKDAAVHTTTLTPASSGAVPE